MTNGPGNQLRKYIPYYLGAGLLGLLLFPTCLIFAIMTLARGGSAGYIVLGVCGSTIAFLVALLGLGAAWWSRSRADQVDDLLEGRNLLAYWDYKIDEHGDPQKGYIYIGRSGVYKNDFYFHFHGKGRRLVKVTVESGRPAKLTFTCLQRNDNSASRKSYPQIIAPVPPGKEEQAKQIARQLNPV